MPLRPELPPGLGLPRRSDATMRLPRLIFPMIGGGVPDRSGGTERADAPPVEEVQPMESSKPEEGSVLEMMRSNPAPSGSSVLASRDCTRVIVYGKAGCPECVEAIQDLIDRQVCFTYHDISRDERALAQLQAICGDAPVVPVIIQMGVRGS